MGWCPIHESLKKIAWYLIFVCCCCCCCLADLVATGIWSKLLTAFETRNTGMVQHKPYEFILFLIISKGMHGSVSLCFELCFLCVELLIYFLSSQGWAGQLELQTVASRTWVPSLWFNPQFPFWLEIPTLESVPGSTREPLVAICNSLCGALSPQSHLLRSVFNPFPSPRLHRNWWWCMQGLHLASP